MKTAKLSIALVVLILLFIFSAYNSQPVQIRFIASQSGDFPLFLIILFSFLLGLFVAGLLGTIRGSQLRREIHSLRRDAISGNRSAAGRQR